MIKIAPSILSADFARLGEDIESVRLGGADYLHFDVMDGLFVPNISIGIPVLESVRKSTDMVLDVHLMIQQPIRYVKEFTRAGADIINIHVEADTEEATARAIELIKLTGSRAAVTIKPKTPAEAALPFIKDVSLILVMTVEPGFGGQGFMDDMLPKVKILRQYIDRLNPVCEMEVDGGINPQTAAQAAASGADVFVAGNAIFRAADRAAKIAEIRKYAEDARYGTGTV